MITNPKAFTLIELIIGAILAVAVFAGLYALGSFTARQISIYVERYNIYTQINYALDNFQRHCVSAIAVEDDSLFETDLEDELKTEFAFEGESRISAITPDNRADNVIYRYCLDNAGNLVRRTSEAPQTSIILTPQQRKDEILVEAKYRPRIYFRKQLTKGDVAEPNFLVVTVSGQSALKGSIPGLPRKIAKMEGFSLWFAEVVK